MFLETRAAPRLRNVDDLDKGLIVKEEKVDRLDSELT